MHLNVKNNNNSNRVEGYDTYGTPMLQTTSDLLIADLFIFNENCTFTEAMPSLYVRTSFA